MNTSKIEVARILRTNQTLAERKLWEQIRARRFMGLKFRRQHPLKGYVVDFYCHKVNLVIEVDGGIHENTRELDEYRQREVMVKSEASFLRFTNEEVLDNIEAVMERISFFITEIHKQKKDIRFAPSPPVPTIRGRGHYIHSCFLPTDSAIEPLFLNHINF